MNVIKAPLLWLTLLALLTSIYFFTVIHDVQGGIIAFVLAAVYATLARALYKAEQDYKNYKKMEQHDEKFATPRKD